MLTSQQQFLPIRHLKSYICAVCQILAVSNYSNFVDQKLVDRFLISLIHRNNWTLTVVVQKPVENQSDKRRFVIVISVVTSSAMQMTRWLKEPVNIITELIHY